MAFDTAQLDPQILRAKALKFLALAANMDDAHARLRLFERAELLDRIATSLESGEEPKVGAREERGA